MRPSAMKWFARVYFVCAFVWTGVSMDATTAVAQWCDAANATIYFGLGFFWLTRSWARRDRDEAERLRYIARGYELRERFET